MIVVLLGLLVLSTVAIVVTVRSVFADRPSSPPQSRLHDPDFRPPTERTYRDVA